MFDTSFALLILFQGLGDMERNKEKISTAYEVVLDLHLHLLATIATESDFLDVRIESGSSCNAEDGAIVCAGKKAKYLSSDITSKVGCFSFFPFFCIFFIFGCPVNYMADGRFVLFQYHYWKFLERGLDIFSIVLLRTFSLTSYLLYS
ncbi:hypothetical protein POJ06DRAFT_141677 [Lipomyces tetrasporus]|uniref:Uncharacterized protein n=1 Tax=Lipomyces tetrasporus TaxID=54092 RepID=A0AAD7QNP6_9ASCO|nr:uncharacterized protein POJ06DRAFT_141677 [Lipomyces tetrasporus]KAJ8098772.1 hypothetical protein POJ06DRAFT_141677 [Lipomyces tetrasporus]